MSYFCRQCVLLIISSFIYLYIFSLAAHSSVILNEVAIQPNQTVELYNTSSESADISSWYIDDAGGTTYFTIPLHSTIPPKSCFLFSSDFNFNKSSADNVRLFNSVAPPTSSSAQLIEQYSYPKAPDINYSFMKTVDGGSEWYTSMSSLGLSNESLVPCIPTLTPTPSPTNVPTVPPTVIPSPTTEPFPTPTPFSTYQNIFISEVYPYPQSNEREWVELYNDNDIQVNLDHWYIDDAENSGSTPKSFSLVINPYTYATVELSSSLLNNGGDVVRLLDSDTVEKDSMEYGKITQGISIARTLFSEDSYCIQKPSKNEINNACENIVSSSINKDITTKIIPTIKSTSSLAKTAIAQPIKQVSGELFKTRTNIIEKTGEVLGVQITQKQSASPLPHLSAVSFLYSLLTIVSIFIKMKNA